MAPLAPPRESGGELAPEIAASVRPPLLRLARQWHPTSAPAEIERAVDSAIAAAAWQAESADTIRRRVASELRAAALAGDDVLSIAPAAADPAVVGAGSAAGAADAAAGPAPWERWAAAYRASGHPPDDRAAVHRASADRAPADRPLTDAAPTGGGAVTRTRRRARAQAAARRASSVTGARRERRRARRTPALIGAIAALALATAVVGTTVTLRLLADDPPAARSFPADAGSERGLLDGDRLAIAGLRLTVGLGARLAASEARARRQRRAAQAREDAAERAFARARELDRRRLAQSDLGVAAGGQASASSPAPVAPVTPPPSAAPPPPPPPSPAPSPRPPRDNEWGSEFAP